MTSKNDVALLRRETQTLAAASHRHLAAVYGFEIICGMPMIIMQYVHGRIFVEKIPLPLDIVIEVMLEVAQAVQCLHSVGILHRDIKPRNIGFMRQGEPKPLHFGLAHLENEVTIPGVPEHSIAGTPAYMSSDTIAQERAHQSIDLWAPSVVFFAVVSVGVRPFEVADREQLTKMILSDQFTRPIRSRQSGPERSFASSSKCSTGSRNDGDKPPPSCREGCMDRGLYLP